MGGSTLVNAASDRVISAAAGLPHTQHEFFLPSSTAPWAILRTFSRPSMTTTRYPRFYGGDHVKGQVLLNPNSSQTVLSIDILLRGTIKPGVGGGGSYCFLEYPHHVSNGSASSTPEASSSRSIGTTQQSDNSAFAFSFPFPASVEYGAPAGRPRQHSNRPLHPIPQTTFDVDASVRIEYELVARFTHRTNDNDVRLSEIKTKILFIPAITPAPPSAMRQQAYSRNAPLPGPELDPQGWVPLPSLSVVGFSKHHHRVKLNYALHLASPLTYTRGTSIPCYLWISSDPGDSPQSLASSSSLDSIAIPELLYMRLVRQTRFFENPAKGTEQYLNNQQPRVLEESEEVGHATWWYPIGVQQDRCFRKFEGEIYLPEDLEPSSSFVPLSVKYKVEFLPFNHLNRHIFRHSEVTAVGNNQQLGPNIMLSRSVTVATVAADGPPQRTTSQPRRSSPHFSDSPGGGQGTAGGHGLDRVRDWVRSQGN